VTDRRGLAVVTGASSGIGLAFAERLAADGHPLLLVARREERLREITQRLAAQHGVEAAFVVADLASAEGRATCRDAIDAGGGDVDTVVLNAGFGAMGAVAAVGRERQTEMVALNCEAVVDLACHVLPAMIARGSGDVIVVSSAAAFQPIPYTATYAATKAFELFFVEALSAELHGTGVRAIAACPGPTSTEFGQAAGASGESRWIPHETAEGVVAATLHALERGRARVATGGLARITTVLASVLPRRVIVWGAGALHRKFARSEEGQGH
jgi:short-subunit dehydrogenase